MQIQVKIQGNNRQGTSFGGVLHLAANLVKLLLIGLSTYQQASRLGLARLHYRRNMSFIM